MSSSGSRSSNDGDNSDSSSFLYRRVEDNDPTTSCLLSWNNSDSNNGDNSVTSLHSDSSFEDNGLTENLLLAHNVAHTGPATAKVAPNLPRPRGGSPCNSSPKSESIHLSGNEGNLDVTLCRFPSVSRISIADAMANPKFQYGSSDDDDDDLDGSSHSRPVTNGDPTIIVAQNTPVNAVANVTQSAGRPHGSFKRKVADITPRRSVRGRNNGDLLTNSEVAPSIRETATEQHKGSGSQHEPLSNDSAYNINYYQQQRQRREDSQHDPAFSSDGASQDSPSLPMSQDIPSPPMSPISGRRLDTDRFCYCDNLSIPTECTGCIINPPCQKHRVLVCDVTGCDKRFHAQCIAVSQGLQLDHIASFKCMECFCNHHDDPFLTERRYRKTNERLLRFGLKRTSNGPEDAELQKLNRARVKLEKMLKECVPPTLYDSVSKNTPKPYPCAVKMSDDAMTKHVVLGRRFEISMMMYKVNKCDCCGRVQPGHVDPEFPKQPLFTRDHLINTYHPAWHCTCVGFCKGSQFYPTTRRNLINHYTLNHEGKSPWEFMGLEKNKPNSILCRLCKEDIKLTPEQPVTDLKFARKFSMRNGFGPVQIGPPPADGESRHVSNSRELRCLLLSFTAAEEAAIRQIVPMISIMRLTSGNIGSKGNTHCVWQRSKLNLILPNLPSECNFIVILRASVSVKGPASTQFKRHRIGRALYLLQSTKHEAWQITIDNDRLSQWPEDGDLTQINTGQRVVVVDNEGNLEDILDPVVDPDAMPMNQDGDDAGPAPLQNSEVPEETFEVVVNMFDKGVAAIGEHELIQQVIDDAVTRIRGDDRSPTAATHGVPVTMNNTGNTATVAQSDVLPTDGFANMNTTEYAWAIAFPRVFIPTYGEMAGVKKFRIFHDITAFDVVRDIKPTFNEWCEYMMWRSDGMGTEHPTFALVIYNHKVKNMINQQGRYVLNTSDLDLDVTVDEIRYADSDSTLKKSIERVIKKAQIHSSNVPATPAYARKTFFEFEAITFYLAYVKQLEMSCFYTGSIAEFHDPYLRLLLSNYTRCLTGFDSEEADLIMTSDSHFSQAVQKYKNVVTHYLASKMEIWVTLFLVPIFGIEAANLMFEFAMSRGAIHFHMIFAMRHPAMEAVMEALQTYAETISEAMQRVNEYIEEHYVPETNRAKYPVPPNLLLDKEGNKQRELFCKETVLGRDVWAEFIEQDQVANQICSAVVGELLESEFGMCAIHTGQSPDDFPKPGGVAEHTYRPTDPNMQSSREVLDKRELKMFKCAREGDLFERKANFTNHCGCHKCSGYCLKETKGSRKFNEATDQDAPSDDIFYSEGGRKKWIKFVVKDCRMHFGKSLVFDPSGENNLTRGLPRRENPKLEPDSNGVLKFFGRRNHPRFVQAPYLSTWYGANNDTQIGMINATGKETLARMGPEKYQQFTNNLQAAGLGGLEHHNGSNCFNRYTTKYVTKEKKSSQAWTKSVEELTEEFCNNPLNANKSTRNLVGKHMNEITRGMSTSKDEGVFLLSSGKMARKSEGSTKKCSVSSINIESLGNEGSAAKNADSFNWKNLTVRYSKRPRQLSGENLFLWAAHHSDSKRHIPQFFGYNNTPKWPLDEDYSQFTLALFKPWRGKIDSLRHAVDGTFATTLVQFLDEPMMPASYRSSILRAKNNSTYFDEAAGGLMGGGDRQTPTEGRTDAAHAEAAEAADQFNDMRSGDDQDTSEFADLSKQMLSRLNLRIPPNHDWSDGYVPAYKDALENYKTQYYEKRNLDIVNHVVEQLQLFDEKQYRPENVKSKAQKFLVYHLLYNMKQWVDYRMRNDPEEDPPPTQFTLVEGLPGVGKTFIMMCLRNMVRLMEGRNDADMATAPTGCAAALINGSTHFKTDKIPVKKALNATPSAVTASSTVHLQALRIAMSSVVARFMDEHSMTGRCVWAWLRHRSHELRQTRIVLDRDNQVVNRPISHIDPRISNRPWGGIEHIYSFGDSKQLPPVMQKPFYSKEAGIIGADLLGKLAVAEFLNPPDETEAMSTQVVMDHVLRQDNKIFLRVLDHVRNGCVDDDDCDFLLAKSIHKLSDDERVLFRNAIHLVPTWKLAHEIVFNYLENDMTTPIALVDAVVSSKPNGKNCILKSTNVPIHNGLCEGAVVMLLTNYIPELKIMNGSVGHVKSMHWPTKDGPKNADGNEYVVVCIEQSMIPEEDALIPGKPSTWIPIPVFTQWCEKRCCSIKTIPLRICIALSIHKSQGMTCGVDQQFEKVIIYFPEEGSNSPPGLVLVALSRAKTPEDFAIGNDTSQLSRRMIQKIGTSTAYMARTQFQAEMKNMSNVSMDRTIKAITALDPIVGEQTYDGGCDYLLEWYREKVGYPIP